MADQKIIRKSGIAHYVVRPCNSFYLIYSAASKKDRIAIRNGGGGGESYIFYAPSINISADAKIAETG